MNHERTFDSFESFLEQVQKPGHPQNPNSSVRLGDEFCGCSLREANELAQRGWPDGLAMMEKIRTNIKGVQPVMDERHTYRFAEAGDEVDVDRYITGEPEHMIEYHTQFVPVSGRVVKVIVNLTISGGCDMESYFRRGAVGTMLVDAIENAGLRVELWLCTAVRRNKNLTTTWVKVKESSQPLEVDRLAFMLAHSGCFRRLFFRLYEQLSPEDYVQFHSGGGDGLGAPVDLKNINPDWVYIGAMHLDQIKSDADAIQFVNDTLVKYTEPVTTIQA